VYFDFDEVDAFTVGTLGQPGARVFLLQARRGATSVTIKCEKRQAGAIADYLRRVLVDLPEPPEQPSADALELEMPAEAAFVLGPVGLGYDRENDRLLVQLEELIETDIESDPTEADDDGTCPTTSTAVTCDCFSAAAKQPRSAITPTRWSPLADRHVGGVVIRSTPTVMHVRA